MNLGVETLEAEGATANAPWSVSAFSDESWGGDPPPANQTHLSQSAFQHSLMNLGVETPSRI